MERSPSLLRGIPSSIGFVVVMFMCMTIHAAEQEPKLAGQEVSPPKKPLDLKAPDITKILSADELDRLVKGTVDANFDEVKVEGARDLVPDTPVVWPGLLAPFWALAHPTQAWRIFAPLPSDQVKDRRN